MPNKTYAIEWIGFAERNLETARLLIREQHYTDSIAIEIQQTIEKTLKAVYAWQGVSIPRTHTLMLLLNFAEKHVSFHEFNTSDLIAISDYYETDRYPGPRYEMPERQEVEQYFILAEKLLTHVRDTIKK